MPVLYLCQECALTNEMRTAPRKLRVYGQIHQFSSVLFVHTDTKDGLGKRTPATKDFSFAP
jgi:hypothetical protein